MNTFTPLAIFFFQNHRQHIIAYIYDIVIPVYCFNVHTLNVGLISNKYSIMYNNGKHGHIIMSEHVSKFKPFITDFTRLIYIVTRRAWLFTSNPKRLSLFN